MPTDLAEFVAYGLYLLLGPITWGLFGAGLYAGRRRMSLIRQPVAPTDPHAAPRVTIIVPAKDEAERIGACIRSALSQDYPNFSVIAIDDRSTDGTGRILDELMAAHGPRLRVLHVRDGDLPKGWTGKCNALHTALPAADGEYLLFVDSDVILQPEALSATMSLAMRKNCDLVSLLPRFEGHTLGERLLVPLAGAGIATLYLIALTNNNHHPAAFANGQYLLIRRSAYAAIGGHAAVRGAFCEDVEIARRLKPRGYKVRLAMGSDLASVRMYSSLTDIVRGWSRNYYAASHGSPWRILLGIAFLWLCCLPVCLAAAGWGIYRVAYPIIPLGGEGWILTATVHLTFMLVFVAQLYTWSGNRRYAALLFPLGTAGLMCIFVRALNLCATGRVEWRGTQYGSRPAASPAVQKSPAIAGPTPVGEGQ